MSKIEVDIIDSVTQQNVTINKNLIVPEATSSNQVPTLNQASKFGFKNRIINGDFSVWQRGTSFTFAGGTEGYTSDRFKAFNTSDGQFTVSKTTLNNKNALKITVDTAVTDLTLNKYWCGISYRFEGQHLYDLAINGKDIIISFLFNSNITSEYSICMRNLTNTTTNVQSYVTSFNYTTANTPQKIEIIIPLNTTWNPSLKNDALLGFDLFIGSINQGDYVTPSTNVWLDGNYVTTSTAVNWGATAGNFIEIAELQLEEGNVATEFEYVPYDVQLLRCMRYYEKLWAVHPNPADATNCGSVYRVIKRTTPTVTYNMDSGSDLTNLVIRPGEFYFKKPDNSGVTFFFDAEL